MKQAKKNWLIFTPGSLQYCSQNYCTVVPEMTVFLFAEITAFLFPVYSIIVSIPDWCDWQSRIRQRIHFFSSSFQFQIGAIGRVAKSMRGEVMVVSIPDWCDWQPRNLQFRPRKNTVSIPDWCDWQNTLSGK